MLMSDAIPVTPIRPIPDERRRRQVSEQVGKADDAVRGGRPMGEAQERRSGTVHKEDVFELPAGRREEGPVTANPLPLSADPVTGFVTQSIYQEAMGAGLHIEPWDMAIEAYRKAEAVPLPRSAASQAAAARTDAPA